MIIFLAAFLGILQTFTEIFPLSSTAHHILLDMLFGFKKSYPAYDVMIDCGVLLAYFVYFSKDIASLFREAAVMVRMPFSRDPTLSMGYPYGTILGYLLASTLITGFVRVTFEDAAGTVGHWRVALGLSWAIMGFLLLLGRRFENGSRSIYLINHQDAFLIGLAQGLAVFPGISRIGITLLVAMALGMERREAARYSFLLAVPYTIGAILYKFRLGPRFFDSDQIALFIAFTSSAIAGILFLAMAMRMIERSKFYLAGYYCIAIGLFTIGFSLARLPLF